MPDASPSVGDPAANEQALSGEAASPAPPLGAVVAALAGLAGGWLAAGSTGILAHSLRHALTWVAMGVALVAAWPPRPHLWDLVARTSRSRFLAARMAAERLALLIVGIIAAVALAASPLQPANALAVAVFLAALAATQPASGRRVLVLVSVAVAVLGIYRVALTSIAMLWLAADRVGAVLGRIAAAFSGQPLRVGATFGGLDFLVAMAALYAGWLRFTGVPRLACPAVSREHGRTSRPWHGSRRRAVYALLAILSGHLVYLVVLSFGSFLRALLPEPPPPRPYHFATDPSTWTVALAVRTLVPWNFPALAAAIQLVVAGCMFRWVPWRKAEESASVKALERESVKAEDAQAGASALSRFYASTLSRSPALFLSIAAGSLALLLPILTTLSLGKADLRGKKIVAYEKGFLNWLEPRHGDYGRFSIGMYGMMPHFVESLGGTFHRSLDLSEDDLRDADAVILMYPNTPWQEGQLERLWGVAQRGGSILVFSDHTIWEPQGGGNRANDVLAPTHMWIRFDTAEFEVGGWLHTYDAIAHPATTGLRDDRNQFGVVIGASVYTDWPARPFLMGRMGWADAGDRGSSAALLGNRRYDAGEKLGDIILASEEPFGNGKVIAFGDTSSMTNGISMGAHVFTSRLLAYAVGGRTGPQAPWREILGLIVALGLIILLAFRPQAGRVACAAILLAISLILCTALSFRASETLPEKRPATVAEVPNCSCDIPLLWNSLGQFTLWLKPPRDLAYIDATHIAGGTDESERPDGVLGLKLTLMRNGYLTLDLPEFTAERLQRAGLLISVAPTRAFTRAERQIVKDFVEGGGIFISTVGWEDERPSRALLADFGLYVGYPPVGPLRSADANPAVTRYFRPPDGPPGATDDPTYAPQPLGHFKSQYLDMDSYLCYVRYHAAWPVACFEPDARPIANGHIGPAVGGVDVPVIIERKVGQGKVVLVGDYAFAMNKNLENMDGSPFEGMRENADFWRWFITELTKPRSQWWIPPKQEPATAPPSAPAEE